jgi:aryl-alcohol dehydrogenase-like predicted oxidoreductase
MIERAILGKTGVSVSRLGFGLAEIGGIDDFHTVDRLLNTALDNGINFLDTGECYGASEAWAGKTIAKRRNEFILATKAGHIVDGYQGEEWTYQTITDSIDRSLKRMNTGYLDILQLHSCGLEILQRGDAIRALQDARQAGKVRFLGYSDNNEVAAAHWAIESGCFDTLQTLFNLALQTMMDTVIPEAEAKGLGIIVRHPIASAAIGGQPKPGKGIYGYFRERSDQMFAMGPIPSLPSNSIYLALGFTLAFPQVDTAIAGTRNLEHMKENIELMNNWSPLSPELVDIFRQRHERL